MASSINETIYKTIKVSSEVGRLRKLLIHRPDGVIGRIIPEKAEEWLYDDIIFQDKMRWEYYHYVILLLFFLDKEVLDEDLQKSDSIVKMFLETPFYELVEDNDKLYRLHQYFNPSTRSGNFHNSSKVLDVTVLLRDLLKDKELRNTIVTAVCTLEGISDKKRIELLQKDSRTLTVTLISGDEIVEERKDGTQKYRTLFPPIPNLIFTRDIGVTANEHILISNAAKKVRKRESLFMKYVFKYHPLFRGQDDFNPKVVELADDEINLDRELFFVKEVDEDSKKELKPQLEVEGGDVMMVNGKYLLIGRSERTNAYTIKKIAEQVFSNDIGIEKVIGVKIPKNRSSMHLDTIMTQVNTHEWVIYKPFIMDKMTEVMIYTKENYQEQVATIPKTITQTIVDELYPSHEDVEFIYCGNNEFPHDRREQWTDGCNLLALMPGIAVGYDRNTMTSEAFKAAGYEIFQAQTFIKYCLENKLTADDFVGRKMILLLPSGELSRARGGSHCMSMPLFRDEL